MQKAVNFFLFFFSAFDTRTHMHEYTQKKTNRIKNENQKNKKKKNKEENNQTIMNALIDNCNDLRIFIIH